METPQDPEIENSSSNKEDQAENRNQDELTMEQEKKIVDEIRARFPLIGKLESLDGLQQEFENDCIYSAKVTSLKLQYSSIRRTRPDGNCFLRGFLFAYLDYCVKNRQELTKLKNFILKSKQELFDLGFPKFTTEDFYDMFIEVVNDLECSGSSERVENVCNDPGSSDYLIVYLRLLISAHLQKNIEFFNCFIEGGRTVDEFCKQEVEPMYRECDHLHIVALTSALDVGVCVLYLDRGEGEKIASHTFPEDKEPLFHMLYRPTHYDLIYKKN